MGGDGRGGLPGDVEVVEGAGEGEATARRPITPRMDEHDWNTFVSKLEDDLKQGAGRTAPEQYRQAIDDYFKALAAEARSPSEGSKN